MLLILIQKYSNLTQIQIGKKVMKKMLMKLIKILLLKKLFNKIYHKQSLKI